MLTWTYDLAHLYTCPPHMNLLITPGDAALALKIDSKQRKKLEIEAEKERKLQLRLDSSLDTRSTGDRSSGSVTTVGSLSKKLNVKERDGEWLEVARSAWDVPKLTAFFGRSYCWAYVCTSKPGSEAHMVCNHAGEPGHEVGGDMHSVSEDKREYVRMNSKLFRPEWYKKRQPAPNSPNSGTGNE
jgi:hypothetical protein